MNDPRMKAPETSASVPTPAASSAPDADASPASGALRGASAGRPASLPGDKSAAMPKTPRFSRTTLNVLTALVGVGTLAIGVGWVIYDYVVNLEIPYFGIPLVLTVPVIVAVTFRNCWD